MPAYFLYPVALPLPPSLLSLIYSTKVLKSNFIMLTPYQFPVLQVPSSTPFLFFSFLLSLVIQEGFNLNALQYITPFFYDSYFYSLKDIKMVPFISFLKLVCFPFSNLLLGWGLVFPVLSKHSCPMRVFCAAHPHPYLAMFLIIASLMGVEREW